ncbi:hypothetical protein PSCFBP2116_03201 [Pseudomonas syringae]|uniref:Uncharacterized protein n=1 Tax=Pseudomonas syringae TaxID=317 RepID=A0A2K4WU25_PSESX|nr:hypothetical protein ALQ45_00919 [Pseudomonas amygdali pv. morsprunorum]RMU33646.1 hypothetical protein ALP31_03212 [Pseudomonas amygdali pv. morsprunorum]SOS39403.1 hypothetical protein CFBP3840_02355 [Pseudomonas syringae]SPD82712.1 hypothetical protein PSCFBP2116_03201 [Pseudomonas syringae]
MISDNRSLANLMSLIAFHYEGSLSIEETFDPFPVSRLPGNGAASM